MGYEELLQRARARLPEAVFEKARFEIPNARGHLEGNKTVVSNFPQIAASLRRPVDHLLKFLLKELATPGEMRRSLLVLGTKVGSARINQKLRQYAEEFVFCRACGKPDTDIKAEGDFSVFGCHVCGNRTQLKSKI